MTESKRGGWRLSPGRTAIVGALLLGALPMWTLPLMIAGNWGFLMYLGLSNTYYAGARAVLGSTLFPAQEFGVVPNGVAGILLSGAFYAVVGAALGWVVGAALTRSRRTA